MQYDCNHCEYSTTRKFNFERHEKSHTQSKPEIGTHEIGYNITQESIKHTYPNEDYNVNNIQNQHNIQYGNGQNTHHNGDYNKVVGIAQELKQQCQVKDNAIRVRDTFLTANNSKLQDEITKNKILIEQNRNIMEENNELVLEKENLISDGNDKLSAMGEDIANVIHKNKILRRKYKKKNLSSKYEGGGYRNKFKTKKAPTSIFVGKDNPKASTILKTGPSGTIAPTTVYILNDGKTAYVRGENQLVGCGFDFSEISQRSKGIGGMLRGRK